MFENSQILMTFSGLYTENWSFFHKNLRIGYVCIEELFDIIFNMGYGEGSTTGRLKEPMIYRVKKISLEEKSF